MARIIFAHNLGRISATEFCVKLSSRHGKFQQVVSGQTNPVIKVYVLLLTGVAIASSASLLVRWTGAVPFAVIAFYRVFISSALLVPIHVHKKGLSESAFTMFHWQYAVAGFFLAGHFITWIASLQMTTIANSIFLQGTHPLFAAVFSALFLKEAPRRSALPFFVLAGFGMYLIVYSDLGLSKGRVVGDILAISSAALVALYLMVARMYKADPDLVRYLIEVYGAASVFCLLYLLITQQGLTGYGHKSWFMLFLLAIGPNLMGHSILNWASRHIEIYKVNFALLLEPVLATLGGMAFFNEFPGAYFYWGAGLIIVSVALLIYMENKSG